MQFFMVLSMAEEAELKGKLQDRFILHKAEATRFELARSCPLLAFQASALDHYATPPPYEETNVYKSIASLLNKH